MWEINKVHMLQKAGDEESQKKKIIRSAQGKVKKSFNITFFHRL
jgi:hypothetical protein